jgi:hypothetical protein
MPLPDLTEDEHADLVRLLRDVIAADRYFLAPRAKQLKSILAKPDPEPAPAVTPYQRRGPAPNRASYQKLSGGRRRR